VLATTASLGAIFHSTARVGSHLQQQGERRREFSHLRGKLQFILFKMTSDGDSEALQTEFEELLAKLVDLTSELEPDIAATLSLREAAQADLKAILTSLGVTTKGIVDETDQVPATAQSAPKLIETVAEVPAAQPAAPTAEVKSDEHPNFTAGSPGAD
jgi:plasmid stabilization system protein ParE